MTTTHTPGPWYCDPSDTKHDFPLARQQVFGGGYLLAEVTGNGKGGSGANASLIAASPTMYDYIADRAKEGDERAKAIIASIGND